MATIESPTTASTAPTAAKSPARKPAATVTPPAAPVAVKKRAPAAKRAASATAKPVPVAARAKTDKPTVAPGAAATPAKAQVAVPTEAKATKEKKPKMVRDSVTIPKAEYQALDAMKQRAAQLQTMVKKTELIRAGIKHLSSLPDAAFLAAIAAVPSLKTGRPSKD
jgi:hypothetical protein